ncbi:MAG: hypothetical protein Q7J48_10240 [Nocardioides sp.]|nr:hypothetical protein [Nocardioides sp.]
MSTAPLQVERRPRWRPAVWALVAAAVLAVTVWYVNSPNALPTSDRMISASTPVDQPVYVGVFAPESDFGRTLHLSGVKVHTTSNTEVSVVPMLCRGGTIGVTTEPKSFCAELVNPEGETFRAGDDIVLEISSAESAIAVIDRVRIGYRDGLQWGTHEAGAGVVVRILAR